MFHYPSKTSKSGRVVQKDVSIYLFVNFVSLTSIYFFNTLFTHVYVFLAVKAVKLNERRFMNMKYLGKLIFYDVYV